MSATATLNEQPTSSISGVPKAIWIALGTLALATAGMAGALVMRATQAPTLPAPQVAVAPVEAPAQLAATPKAIPQAPLDAPEEIIKPKPVAKPKPQPAKVQQATGSAHAPAPAPQQTQQVAQGAGPAPMVVQQPAVCYSCGTVMGVTEVKQKAQQGSGVGAVGGAVVGGLLGNQVGKGNGRTAMTVLGAVGGGLAGNEIEKHVKTTTVYDVQVRMEDGSTRTVRQSAPVSVGTRVTVDGNQLRVGSGSPQPAVIRTNG
jgi:outer membrane lipoprotein SlyB